MNLTVKELESKAKVFILALGEDHEETSDITGYCFFASQAGEIAGHFALSEHDKVNLFETLLDASCQDLINRGYNKDSIIKKVDMERYLVELATIYCNSYINAVNRNFPELTGFKKKFLKLLNSKDFPVPMTSISTPFL